MRCGVVETAGGGEFQIPLMGLSLVCGLRYEGFMGFCGITDQSGLGKWSLIRRDLGDCETARFPTPARPVDLTGAQQMHREGRKGKGSKPFGC